MSLASPATVARFHDAGFVAVPDVFTSVELATLRVGVKAAVDRIALAPAIAGDRHVGPTSDRYTEQFRQCLNLWEDGNGHGCDHNERPRGYRVLRTPYDAVFDPRLAATAAALLGVPAVRIWQDQALFKPPGGSPTYAHQDCAYWPMASATCVTAWIPLAPTGSTRATGAMGYVHGSHRADACFFADIARVNDVETLEANERRLLARPEWNGAPCTYVDADPGTVVFHHGRTVHRALPNTSDEVREVFTVVYMADGVVRGSTLSALDDVPHFVADTPRVPVGTRLVSPRMPIAYASDKEVPSRL